MNTHFSPFESDGVYAGIPYRVLPDCSIEAMMPGGLVKFKNMDQLVDSAAGAPAITNAAPSILPYDVSGNANGGSANVPAKPFDYYSILVEAIKNAEENSAHLRALVYERARFNFKRDVLFGHPSAGLNDLVRHIDEFELAVARIEANANDRKTNPAYRENEREPADTSIEMNGTEDQPDSAFQEQAELLDTARPQSNNAVQILRPGPISPMYAGPIQRMEDSQRDRRLEDFVPQVRFANQLIGILVLAIVFIGAVIVAGMLWRSPTISPQIETANQLPKAAETTVKQDSQNDESGALKDNSPKVAFPLPASYGIYVLSDNKLTELQSLPISVPDPRIALSAELKIPPNVTISDSKPAFILFRRDLLNNAPQKITLRAIARVTHETKIVDGKAVVTDIEGTWRIRNISREFRVSPVPGQREMIMARADDNEPLAAGRYALVLNRVGYDFTVEGPAQSAEFCLEGFEAANGTVFTQCRAP